MGLMRHSRLPLPRSPGLANRVCWALPQAQVSRGSGTINEEQSPALLMMERPPEKKEPRLLDDTDDQSEWRGRVINSSWANYVQREPVSRNGKQTGALRCSVLRSARSARAEAAGEHTAPLREQKAEWYWASC